MCDSNGSSSSSSSSYLVHYLRDWQRIPFGCLVAIDSEHIGVSICSPKDKFNKKRARDIAYGRALYCESRKMSQNSDVVIPNRLVEANYGDKDDRTWSQPPIPMRQYVKETVEWFRERAARYFKESGQSN